MTSGFTSDGSENTLRTFAVQQQIPFTLLSDETAPNAPGWGPGFWLWSFPNYMVDEALLIDLRTMTLVQEFYFPTDGVAAAKSAFLTYLSTH